MSAVALHDASDLAATVSRAMALLDAGDVEAARMLAAAAYDQAKAAAGYAKRFKAAEGLVAKARRLQADALLIEARAKMRMAADYDAAQEAGVVAKGRPKTLPDGNSSATVEELGLSSKDVHEARKLAEAERKTPGIVERAIAARLAAGLEPSRANLRAAVGTASATAAERGNNLYETPAEAMRVLLALERFSPRVYEPACGRGAIVRPLEAAGYDVSLSDLVDYGTATKDGECQEVADFLASFPASRVAPPPAAADPAAARATTPGGRSAPLAATEDGPDIVTNPPYGAELNAFVAHALRVHRPRKMALLLNLNFLCGFDDPDRCFAMDENRPARIHVFTRRLPMMHRDGWDGPEAQSRMNCAWFVWERAEDGTYPGPTIVTRVDWKDFAERPALGPFSASRPVSPAEAGGASGGAADDRRAAVAAVPAAKPRKRKAVA